MDTIIAVAAVIVFGGFTALIILCGFQGEKAIKAEGRENRFFSDKDFLFLARIKGGEWFVKEEDHQEIYDLGQKCLVGDIRYDQEKGALRASVLPHTMRMIAMDLQSRGIRESLRWLRRFRAERRETISSNAK